MILNCPLPTSLTSVPPSNCPFRFDQIVKLLFQRRGAAPFADEDAMKLLATWTPLLSAVDNTKVVASPIFTGFVIPPSEALTQGGNDNSTFNGIREYYGEGSVTASGNFKNMDPKQKKALMLMSQESLSSSIGVSNLTVFMVNKDGRIFHNDLKGFPVYNVRVGSRGSEGYNAPDLVPISFDFPPDWDVDAATITPSFDPLTALVNPVTP